MSTFEVEFEEPEDAINYARNWIDNPKVWDRLLLQTASYIMTETRYPLIRLCWAVCGVQGYPVDCIIKYVEEIVL